MNQVKKNKKHGGNKKENNIAIIVILLIIGGLGYYYFFIYGDNKEISSLGPRPLSDLKYEDRNLWAPKEKRNFELLIVDQS